MRFSVLIPTRNRLEYLRYAVESVLRQGYDSWELIISDNCSDEDVGEFVSSLRDPRILYARTERPLPVTDNWNLALSRSSGDYVVMLGDDDCLMPGYFRAMHLLAEAHREPDLIYNRGFIYAYPGVLPGSADGQLFSPAYVLGTTPPEPYWLDSARARRLVERSTNFRLHFGYNMQFSLINSRMVEAVGRGEPFFQSPFPDYYATNALFLAAERILVNPRPVVVIGMTPKSYGYFHFNRREAEGVAFLGAEPDPETAARLQSVLLPGTNINDGWLFAMEKLRSRFRDEFQLEVNYQRYRWLQILHVYEALFAHRLVSEAEIEELRARLRPGERLISSAGAALMRLALRLMPAGRRTWFALGVFHYMRAWLGQFPRWPEWVSPHRYGTVQEVLDQVDPLAVA